MTLTGKEINTHSLTSQVEELISLLDAFKTVLSQEEKAIKSADAEKLTKISQDKQTIAVSLNDTGLAIEESLAGEATNLVDFSVTERFSELAKPLQDIIKKAINLTIDCHDKNLANGMSIKILSNINQHAIDLVSGKPQQEVKLYGSSGEKTQSGQQTTLGKA